MTSQLPSGVGDPTTEVSLPCRSLLPACSSLCGSGPGAAAGPKGTHGGSLMHSVMKLASGVAPDNGTVQMLAFSLLANLAVSRECRGVLQKVSESHLLHSRHPFE